MEDFEKTFCILKQEPILLFVLYQIWRNPKNPELPQFMDLGKLSKKLESKGLVVIQDQVHIHKNIPQISPFGKKFLNLYAKDLDILFNNISLKSESDFLESFYSNLKELDKKSFNLDIQTLQDLFKIPKLSQFFELNNIHIKINCLDVQRIKNSELDQNLIEVTYDIIIICLRCKNNQCSNVSITYNLEEYKLNPQEIHIKCSKCGISYYLDGYFSRIFQEI